MAVSADFQAVHPYVGFVAIDKALGIQSIQPLTATSKIGPSKEVKSSKGFTVRTFQPVYAPTPTLRGHFEFGLKYDDLNLEWLHRLFFQVPPDWIEDWLADAPNSAYARRTACLYEWFTGRKLDAPDTSASNYEPLVSPAKYFVATVPERNRRWRIDNNLPGTPTYCPLIRWTQELRESSNFDLSGALADLDEQFGADLLVRSAAWLTFAESRASFAIEREQDRADDIKRFASAMTLHCGKIEDPISPESLVVLQREVLGSRALRTGVRMSPVFIGSAAHFDVTNVRYVAPPWETVAELLEGLRAFEVATRGASPLVRAAALAFGFVYIHPLSDGNGRVHRLLINDTLLRDGAVPAGTILPISATILERSNYSEYEKVLNSLSEKQVKRHSVDWSFSLHERVCEDGVSTNFEFRANEQCMPFWRFPDLSYHCHFICNVLRQTVEENMTSEAAYLVQHDRAMMNIKKVVEMPDRDAERIIRALRENNGAITNLLAKQYPTLFSESSEVEKDIVEAVTSAFSEQVGARHLVPQDRRVRP